MDSFVEHESPVSRQSALSASKLGKWQQAYLGTALVAFNVSITLYYNNVRYNHVCTYVQPCLELSTNLQRLPFHPQSITTSIWVSPQSGAVCLHWRRPHLEFVDEPVSGQALHATEHALGVQRDASLGRGTDGAVLGRPAGHRTPPRHAELRYNTSHCVIPRHSAPTYHSSSR